MLSINFFVVLCNSCNKLTEEGSDLHDFHEEIVAWRCEMPFSRAHSSFVIDPGFKAGSIHTTDNIIIFYLENNTYLL